MCDFKNKINQLDKTISWNDIKTQKAIQLLEQKIKSLESKIDSLEEGLQGAFFSRVSEQSSLRLNRYPS